MSDDESIAASVSGAQAGSGMPQEQFTGSFGNSINSWRDDLVKRERQMVARHARLERQGSPETYGYSVLIKINKRLIRKLEREYQKALINIQTGGGRDVR